MVGRGHEGELLGREFVTAVVLFHETVGKLLGVSAVERKTLDVLDRLGPSSNGEIAQHTGLTTGAVTGLIDRLEGRGLVRRGPHERDRRKTVVTLTDHPRRQELTARVFGALRQDMSRLMATFTPDQLDAIAQFQRGATDVLTQHIHRVAEELEN
ncbi:MarR family winged helix-turn-helix transcriptional regulator [Mycobacteroides abscessus]|uniref:MarR family winged helix-turn-helix transcriptional regulator n=1 Tax=Mycobacteroides abscessus TaxID=36809 RepID=UPI0009C84804|nr:MarR family transcriptional regulator [Mycobacteroides abscessus]SKT94041.1 MarR family transcriptional regulator [Mycobacteroides abscessus subsp. massiliense]SKU18846.1 MarR family transcriptional regulator [Mycobacteroides abscessus subsp. massiliense]